jgi:anti-sigma B factor antagonist
MEDLTGPWTCQTSPALLRVEAQLRVEAHTGHDEIVLAFSGEADVSTSAVLAHALGQATDHGHQRVTIDLTGLEFIDTHCLSLIFGAHERIRDTGAELRLRAPQPSVRRLLDILERQDMIEPAWQDVVLGAL